MRRIFLCLGLFYSFNSFACPKMAFTFDDGPIRGRTETILSILKEHDVRATFFVVGRNVHNSRWLVQKIEQEGHDVGVHSYTHSDLKKISAEKVSWEIGHTKDMIEEAIGHAPLYWRAPYGSVPRHAPSFGMRHVLWTIDSLDYLRPSVESEIQKVSGRFHNKAIVLFHDHAQSTISALSQLITLAHKQGYALVPLRELYSDNNDACTDRRLKPTTPFWEDSTSSPSAEDAAEPALCPDGTTIVWEGDEMSCLPLETLPR